MIDHEITSKEGVRREMLTAKSRIEFIEEEKLQYQDMKNNLENNIIPKLTAAKNWILNAKEKLTKSYTGQESQTRCKSLESNSEEIEKVINVIKKCIIPKIKTELISLNSQLNELNTDYETLKKMYENW